MTQSIQKIFTCLLLARSDGPPLRLAFHARYPTRLLDVKEGCRRAKTSASPREGTAANCRLSATPPHLPYKHPGDRLRGEWRTSRAHPCAIVYGEAGLEPLAASTECCTGVLIMAL
ncbi:hypothetical protein ROHU_003559 [Labeo rohita]|uniref:Uncharacterized protein n=1 Tax=Labeo rohita TaxID=84645 RepID=A0A498NUU1_LABRO|nr:hypothetical protein ROHU_003559 [Labeo rohita]